jgi:regulator of protease activity HflC (stomatin/prohibitin superfamily)
MVVAVLVFGLLLFVLWPTIHVTIESGHAGVYYSLLFGGTDTTWIRNEGLQLKFPWDKIYDYDLRIQHVPFSYTVISSDGLTVQCTVSVRCQPRRDSLGLLQKYIGPNYIEKFVLPQTQTVVRTVIGREAAEAVYRTNGRLLEESLRRTMDQLSVKYISIDNILITSIEIPEALKKAIESKLIQAQNSQRYDFVITTAQKEANRKRIEARGIRDFQNIVAPGITENFLRWKGIDATVELAKSNNSKVVVVGAGNGLPLILDTASGVGTRSSVPSAPRPGGTSTADPNSSAAPPHN